MPTLENQEIAQEAEANQLPVGPDSSVNSSVDLSVDSSASTQVTKPRLWRKLRRGVSNHPRLLVQLAVLLMLLGGTSTMLLHSLFKGAWSQHQDNVAILGSILKMELGHENSRAIPDDNTQRVVTRSFSTLESHVEADGWKWLNRFGSTITYGKRDQRLIASCSPYSPLYVICDLSEIP
jgi:hypothetical protein